MADATRTRSCGNCGAAVGDSATICPACDALLAAYETPAGAVTASDVAARAVFDAHAMPDPATTKVTVTVTGGSAETESPAQSVAHVDPLPGPTPADAHAALDAGRRPRDRTTAPPAGPRPSEVSASTNPDPVAPVIQPKVEERADTGPTFRDSAPPERIQVRDVVPPPAGRATAAQSAPVTIPPAPAGGGPRRAWEPTLPPDPPASRVAPADLQRYVVIIPLLLIGCWMLVTFDMTTLLMLLFVVAILFNLIKSAAKFSGRKTTTMRPPGESDRWHR